MTELPSTLLSTLAQQRFASHSTPYFAIDHCLYRARAVSRMLADAADNAHHHRDELDLEGLSQAFALIEQELRDVSILAQALSRHCDDMECALAIAAVDAGYPASLERWEKERSNSDRPDFPDYARWLYLQVCSEQRRCKAAAEPNA